MEWSAKSTDGNSRSRIQDSNVILTDDPHGICGQSARYIAHLLPNFPGTRVTSFSTDGNLRLKFTVFARVFAFRLLRPLLLHRNQFRLYATISALESPGTPLCVLEGQVSSFLLARERKRLCVLAWPLRCLFPPPLVPARRRQRAPQGACLSLQCKRRYAYNALRQNQKRCVGRKALPSENSTTKGGVFRDTGASMRICFHRECFCMQTVTQSASRLTVTPCNAHTPHAGTSTRGEGKRHRSGQARTHMRFRSRARDRNLRSGTNTNSTAFRRCSDRSEPRSR